jgi:acyl carrier protein
VESSLDAIRNHGGHGYVSENEIERNLRDAVGSVIYNDLLSEGIIDSLGMMKLIRFIEDKFDLKVRPEDMTIENFTSIETISNYIQGRKSRQ